MDRMAGRRTEPPRGRKSRDGAIIGGAIVVLLLALVGVVSAGNFVAGKFSGSSSTPTGAHSSQSDTRTLAMKDVARARLQATAIVRLAQSTGHAIVARATRKAKQRASALLGAARRRAAGLQARVVASNSRPQPPPVGTGGGVAPAPVSVQPTPNAVPTALSNVIPTAPPGIYPTPPPYPGPQPGTGVVSSNPPGVISRNPANGSSLRTAAAPNLRGVPASWKIVGYGAVFDGRLGSAGSISVINRGSKTLSGVVRVRYVRGGVARAFFADLAPGQRLVLPLNGPAYRGGGYVISVPRVRA